jgi:hypothetical protein
MTDSTYVSVSLEEYSYLLLRDAQLEFALDMIPNLDDVIEQRWPKEDEE